VRKFIKKVVTQNTYDLLVKTFFLLKQINLEIKLQNLNFFFYILKNFFFSKSQINQELIALFLNNNHQKKEVGYFVEIGACDGITLSNTYFLEKKLKWKGLLCEPSKYYIKNLRKNRKSKIETKIILDKPGKNAIFMETEIPELSTIKTKKIKDTHSKIRKAKKEYKKKTISLNDLFLKHKVPKIIDFMTIDTEGSEYKILKNFNFKKYFIKLIICEHNFSENRLKIYKLLKKNGYVRKFTKISFFDDWYFRQ